MARLVVEDEQLAKAGSSEVAHVMLHEFIDMKHGVPLFLTQLVDVGALVPVESSGFER